MVRLVVAIALAGCATWEDPTGVPQVWPPPLGISVETVTTGDVDGDGISELAVLSSGPSSQDGAFFIRGDAGIASGQLPTQFATFQSLPVAAPAAATTVPDRVYVVYSQAGNVELARFDHHFDPIGKPVTLSLPPSGTVLWATPAGTTGLVVGSGTAISYLEEPGTEVAITSTLAPPVALGAVYTDSGKQMLLVASATDVETIELTAAGPAGTWQSARSGAVWRAQVAVDLDRDGYPEIVGYDAAMHAVCALELTFGQVACVTIATVPPYDATTIVVADMLGGAPLDIVVAFASADAGELALLGDISYDGATLAAGTQSVSGTLAVTAPHWFAIARGPTHKTSLAVTGRDGSMSCAICN